MKKNLFFIFLSFFGGNLFAQNIANFESWHNFSVLGRALTVPTNWNASDSLLISFGALLNPGGTFVAQVAKETPGRNGTDNAMRVESKGQDAVTGFLPAGPTPGMATNGKMGVDQASLNFVFTGGVTHVGIPVSASFWVKNNPVGGDSTEVSILAIDNSDGDDSLVAIIDTIFGNSISSYTQINMPFTVVNGTLTPNILRVIVNTSSNATVDSVSGFTNVHTGTYIIVDDIEITSPAGVLPVMKLQEVAEVYPSITQGSVFIRMKELGKKYTLQVMDAKGSAIQSHLLSNAQHILDLSTCTNGMYYFVIKNDKNEILQTGKIQKQ